MTSPREEAKMAGKSNAVVEAKIKKIKKVVGKCSWCDKETEHVLVSKHYKPKRSKYQCCSCFHTTVKCRLRGVAKCSNFAKVHRGWFEAVCTEHKVKQKEKQVHAYCSWCLNFSSHTVFMDNPVTRFVPGMDTCYYCDDCHKPTKKCKKCDTAFARIGGMRSTSKCFKCCKIIKNWGDEENIKLITKSAFCPWCCKLTDHELKEHFKKGRKDIYSCHNCTMETKSCGNCDTSMVAEISFSSKCSCCKKKALPEDYWGQFRIKFETAVEEYQEPGYVERQLERKSDYYIKAKQNGLLRPFLLLVTMHPGVRSVAAFKLEIQIARFALFGDPHAEADRIIFHKKGIQRRSNAIKENIGIKHDANWYQILRRTINDLAGYSTFKSQKGSETVRHCVVPTSDLISELEIELLDNIAQRHLNMLPEDVREKAIELYDHPEISALFETVRQEGLNSDALFIMFIAIILTHGAQEEKMCEVKVVKYGDFVRFLKSYLQGKNPVSNRLKTAQDATGKVLLILTKIVVLKVVAEIVAFMICPPLGVAIEVGFLAVCLPTVILVLLNRSSRDISSPAIVLIVLQRFLTATQNINLSYDAIDL